jgi:DNA end-binding protein Ku
MAERRRRRDDGQPVAHAFWSGTITFGLVSIPVGLFPANRSGGVSLRMLGPAGRPLTRRWVCPKEEREVPPDEVVRGREVEKGRWVLVSDEELEALEPRRSRDIDLREFVPAGAIPPIYFERAYFLAPAGQSTKAYGLLAAIMERSERAGIATFVMHGREYLVAILARHGILRAETLRFADEVRDPDALGLPDGKRASRADVQRMEKAIEAHAGAIDLRKELVDEAAAALRALADRKRKHEQDVVRVTAAGEPDEEPIDLVATIRASLQRRGGRAAAAPSRRGGGRRLETESRQALAARARRLGIAVRTRMTKAELVRAIRERAA